MSYRKKLEQYKQTVVSEYQKTQTDGDKAEANEITEEVIEQNGQGKTEKSVAEKEVDEGAEAPDQKQWQAKLGMSLPPATSQPIAEKIEALQRSLPEKPVVEQIFGGNLFSLITCTTCQYKQQINESFLDLSLSMPVYCLPQKFRQMFSYTPTPPGSLYPYFAH